MDCTNKNCPAYAKCLAPYRGSWCKATRATYGLGDPMTNADRIRQMSDEELARLFDDILKYNVVGEPDENVCSDCYKTDCAPCWLDWLKATVEEVDE